jgi:phosphatidylglycerophosphatase A
VLLIFILLGYYYISRIGLLKEADPLEIVIDEVCGVLVAFWAIPLNILTVPLGFFLFRFFDVTKIFPINWLERKKGTQGIMLDDIGAGIYTWVILKTITLALK